MRRLTRALVTVGTLVLATGCASGGGDEVVTVTSQVVAPPPASPAASPAGSSAPDAPATDQPTDAGTASQTPGAGGGTDTGATDLPAPSEGDDSASGDGGAGASDPGTSGGADSGGAGSDSAGSDSAGSDGAGSGSAGSGAGSGSGFPIQTPSENQPDVSRDVPGADKGRPCAADAKYWDEDPAGMREDVIAAWHNVEKFANADGVIVCLNDGKRSTSQQQAQYDEYVAEYGKEVADQLVLAPENSAHVTGNAMDVQPAAAYQWLQGTEGALGLCRIYDNEPWHFEYDVAYFTDGCPPRLPKPEN